MAPLGDLLTFFLNLSRKGGGDVVEYREGGRRAYLINHPDCVEHVLARNQSNYINPPHPYARLAPAVAPEGAFLLRLGDEGRDGAAGQRRLQQICTLSVRELSAWARDAGLTETWSEPRAIFLPLKRRMLRLMVEALFGVQVEEGAEAFVAAVQRIEESLARRAETPGQELQNAIREEDAFIAHLVSRLAVDGLETAVLRTLLNGFNAPATALSWTLYLLALHPDVQTRVRSEVDRVVGDGEPSAAAIPSLIYTRSVIQEAMRLYPPAWMLGRVALADDQIRGCRILQGAIVSISPYTMHRHPAWWPDPGRFDPERFTAERSRGRPRYAYIPFGGGTRRCTASHLAVQQLQVMLAAIVRHVEVSPVPDRPTRPLPLISLRPHPEVTLRLRSPRRHGA